jgi:uncharacterized Zn-binding protein involved in type VI secretion
VAISLVQTKGPVAQSSTTVTLTGLTATTLGDFLVVCYGSGVTATTVSSIVDNGSTHYLVHGLSQWQ